jgi:hypothetical protein
MRRLAVLLGVLAHGCGPACLDDRCSLQAPTSQVTKVDYTNPSTAGSGSGSAVVVATGSAPPPATGSAPPPATGSATPVATGSAPPPTTNGSGAVTPPPQPPPESATWGALNDSFKQYITSKSVLAQGTVIKIEFVKTPQKTPFVVTLETKPMTEALGAEAVWNDCPENKIVCDGVGVKTHTTKRPGAVLIKGGVNWSVTSLSDDAKGTLVTWTNNLSREILQLRLVK